MALYRPSDIELATGLVPGYVGSAERVHANRHPLTELVQIVLPYLAHPPCYVSFSGGRDSSLILAIAVLVARRAGLPDPIPITERYPDAPKAYEDHWQELVVRALGITNWVRLNFTSENDLLGDSAQVSLKTYGIIWPPAIHIKPAILRAANGGTLLTGEGGDAVFRVQRSTLLRNVRTLEREGPPRLGSLRDAYCASKPRILRYRAARTEYVERMATLTPWLTSKARGCFIDLIAREKADMPLWYPSALLKLATKRDFVLGQSNYRKVARDQGVSVIDPLLHTRFLSALGSHYGRLGPHSRTDLMSGLFDSILPMALLERSTKSFFQEAVLGEPTAEFIRSWSGGGPNTDFVNIDALAQNWHSAPISPMGEFLLQQAWLYDQGLGIDGKPLGSQPDLITR